MGTFLSGRLLYIVEWDNGKINKIKYGAMGNMITDGVMRSGHNKNVNKGKHPWESSGSYSTKSTAEDKRLAEVGW